ncbi:MAG: CBS domain-containing protein [Candidatus Nitricoxidivorans perseverans]|uniref:CBS domain-containing protein n=1 Tax=Candidatus Nitricoxidivorans perseverans TaxID=2975601 RepID=A0AA49IXB6_9PROT|nr:MAG: CBS domain-containing protein [Candidatus Nitricoxidivorans perseverans]
MISDRYKPLPQTPVCKNGCFVLGSLNPTSHIRVDSPALEVMTDLARIPPATVEPQDSFDQANQAMILRGVRLLLVTEDGGRVAGVVTARDLLSEKPVRVANARGVRRHELEVRDVMTPLDQMEAMDMADVAAARVGHVIATLEQCGRQHAIVFEKSATDGRQTLRGIFSASQIARQLGVDLTTHEVARTFAEIEAAFAGV